MLAGDEEMIWPVAVLVLGRAAPPTLLRRRMFRCLELRTLVRLLLLVRFTGSSPVDVEVGKTVDTPSLAPSFALRLPSATNWSKIRHQSSHLIQSVPLAVCF